MRSNASRVTGGAEGVAARCARIEGVRSTTVNNDRKVVVGRSTGRGRREIDGSMFQTSLRSSTPAVRSDSVPTEARPRAAAAHEDGLAVQGPSFQRVLTVERTPPPVCVTLRVM